MHRTKKNVVSLEKVSLTFWIHSIKLTESLTFYSVFSVMQLWLHIYNKWLLSCNICGANKSLFSERKKKTNKNQQKNEQNKVLKEFCVTIHFQQLSLLLQYSGIIEDCYFLVNMINSLC